MENLKKWFNFRDTISGSTFLVRWLIAFGIQFVGGYILGLSIVNDMNMGGLTVGLIIASAGIALQFSSLLKRSKAIFNSAKAAFAFYFAYLVLSIAKGFIEGVDVVLDVSVGLAILVMFAYAIFKNSGNPEASHLG